MFGNEPHQAPRSQREATVANFVFVAMPTPWRAHLIVVEKQPAPLCRTNNSTIPLYDQSVTDLHMQWRVIPKMPYHLVDGGAWLR
jgi:hypothetical protein